jgi:peptidoglycan/xylan/chitin deacetylase (PgdA/CDA1 family)
MDNPYTTWSPIVSRAPLRWPNGAPLAVCVVIHLETMELFPPPGTIAPPRAVGYGPYPNGFQLSRVAAHEYGNRVGVFRVMEALDRYAIPATVAIDGLLARTNPFLVDQCAARGWELIGHGLAYNRMITAEMGRDRERAYIAESLAAVEEASGSRPAGWVGAEYGESGDTVSLLAELGVRYVCDWANDEQPYRMRVPAGNMVALPAALDLDPSYTSGTRSVPIQRWARMVVEGVRRLRVDGAEHGRLVALHLQPHMIGQPFRVKHLDVALRALAEEPVWKARGGEIVDWFDRQHPEAP